MKKLKSTVFLALFALACGSSDGPTGDADPGSTVADASGEVLHDAVPVPDAMPTAAACGWKAGDGEFACGGSDSPPTGGEVTCTGTNCCAGMCAPSASGEICCDTATGVVTHYEYGGGDCQRTSEVCPTL